MPPRFSKVGPPELNFWLQTGVSGTKFFAKFGEGGRVHSPETSDQEISADLPGKERQGKKGKMEDKRRKIKKGKVEN